MDPIVRKKMVVCTPFGEYTNGDQEGVMSKRRLASLAANFNKYPRQVPIYSLGNHVTDLDERLPDGWVEGLEVNDAGQLVADVKIQGEAAAWVLNDMIRGASIGTVQGKNPDGSAQGEVLQHLLLTNNPFDKSLNIAATRKGSEEVAHFTTALPAEANDMADSDIQKENARLKDELAALKAKSPDDTAAKLKDTEALLSEKIRENSELAAANAVLREDVEKFKTSPQLEAALKDIETLKTRNLVAEVRRKVGDGNRSGQFGVGFLGGEAKSTWDHPSDGAVLAWFNAHSIFKGSLDRLDLLLQTMERKTTGRSFHSGDPGQPENVTLTADDRAMVRRLGLDPDKVIAGMKSTNRAEFEELTAKEK